MECVGITTLRRWRLTFRAHVRLNVPLVTGEGDSGPWWPHPPTREKQIPQSQLYFLPADGSVLFLIAFCPHHSDLIHLYYPSSAHPAFVPCHRPPRFSSLALLFPVSWSPSALWSTATFNFPSQIYAAVSKLLPFICSAISSSGSSVPPDCSCVAALGTARMLRLKDGIIEFLFTRRETAGKDVKGCAFLFKSLLEQWRFCLLTTERVVSGATRCFKLFFGSSRPTKVNEEASLRGAASLRSVLQLWPTGQTGKMGATVALNDPGVNAGSFLCVDPATNWWLVPGVPCLRWDRCPHLKPFHRYFSSRWEKTSYAAALMNPCCRHIFEVGLYYWLQEMSLRSVASSNSAHFRN